MAGHKTHKTHNSHKFEEFEISNAADTLVRAKMMKKSEPELFKLAMTHLKGKKKAINELV